MHVYLFIFFYVYIKISMSAHHKLTTALQMANALIWKDHLTVNADQDLQEMGKFTMVGQEYKPLIQRYSQTPL